MTETQHDAVPGPLRTGDLAGVTAAPAERETTPTDVASNESGTGDAYSKPSAPSDEKDQSAREGEREGEDAVPLLASETVDRFRDEWEEIQWRFVDEPRQCVEQADTLVADLMQRLAASFSNERSNLEKQWDRGDEVSTEDLRVSLTRYRTFFQRLLSA
jgi:hypothetical protein